MTIPFVIVGERETILRTPRWVLPVGNELMTRNVTTTSLLGEL